MPASEVSADRVTAAFRVPAHARLRSLVRAVGEPLVSTSVNRTGEAPLATAEEIAAAVANEIDDVVVDPEDAPPVGGVASTIADCTSWPPRLVRAGRFDLQRALDTWSDVRDENQESAGTILFVCTGNTCRSPLAEVLARQALHARGAHAVAASAGVAAVDDAPASPEAREVAREIGLDLDAHRARLLTRPMVLEAALVLVMGERQREFIRVLAPEAMDRVHTLVEYASGGDTTGDVSDPWGGDRSRYRRTRDELKDLVERSLQRWGDRALGRRSGP
jgi:protein-tyrosine-phosphatase